MYGLEEIKAMNAEQLNKSTLRVAKAEVVERAKQLYAVLIPSINEMLVSAAAAHLFQAVRRLKRIEKELGIGN